MSSATIPPTPTKIGSSTTGGIAAPTTSSSNYVHNIAKSLTISEMRELHKHALSEAESKSTELRLVLASRYRELVGSSDEVLDMQRTAVEMESMVKENLPGLLESLVQSVKDVQEEMKLEDEEKDSYTLTNEEEKKEEYVMTEEERILNARRELANAPRLIHSSLDRSDVHGAAVMLMKTFSLISSFTKEYPLVNVLTASNREGMTPPVKMISDPMLQAQMKMIYLHIQTLPARTIKLSKQQLLLQSSSSTPPPTTTTAAATNSSVNNNNNCGCKAAASALSALNLLNVPKPSTTTTKILLGEQPLQQGNKLMDLYFDSKAKLIHRLLSQMTVPTATKDTTSTAAATPPTGGGGSASSGYYTPEATDEAEKILSKIIRILQYDVILYPYQIFILRKLTPSSTTSTTTAVAEEDTDQQIITNLPKFDKDAMKNKASHFLATHLPLIRTKVKTILVAIAGTTASRLGHIRQALYDITDGVDCRRELDGNGLCTWEEAVLGTVDMKIVTHGLEGLTSTAALDMATTTAAEGTVSTSSTTLSTGGTTANTNNTTNSRKFFSLWSTLFSNTFSSLVHSLLSTSFHSVHARVVTTLRASLANAPSLTDILPHEAYRNTLRITTDLDASLKKVSDDAHELLVHAEEREESERRLRQSLYVQTCEIMGRLLNELRRIMLLGTTKKSSNSNNSIEDEEEAAKDLILGRLCHLLKFRLTTLPTLLDPKSSPAVLAAQSGGKVGMISAAELHSAFEIADDNDDGLISFDEAMEAMDGAFSGTHFHGAEVVRETMLLVSGSSGTKTDSARAAPENLTLSELMLLSARGLRHDLNGSESALGIIQRSLDDIIQKCFEKWAHVALHPSMKSFQSNVSQFMDTASKTMDSEWKRLRNLGQDSEEEMLHKEIGDALNDENVGDNAQETLHVGTVSTHVVAYLLSITSTLNQSMCPSDSLPPFPSIHYASAMGIEMDADGTSIGDFTMVHTLRSSLLQEALVSISRALKVEVLSPISDAELTDDIEMKLAKCQSASLVQLYLDISFIMHCFFKRNNHGFVVKESSNSNALESDDESTSVDYVVQSKALLDDMVQKTLSFIQGDERVNYESMKSSVSERHSAVLGSCDLFFAAVFGEDKSSSISSPSPYESGIEMNAMSTFTESPPLLLNPLQSSRRFTLLPIQAEKSLTELQLLGNIGKGKREEAATERVKSASAAASAVSSGLGFLSSMLKKK